MQFNSYSYLVALVLVVLLFWLMPVRLRKWFVLVVSVAFYATWSPIFVLIPLVMCAGSVYAASRMLRHSEGKARWFVGGILFVLIIYAFFRYHEAVGAATSWLASLFLSTRPEMLFLAAAPLGISFYSFEAISFLIDVKQDRIRKLSFSDIFLFLMFWPHLIAGPIVRFRELVPQFSFSKEFDLAYLVGGLDRLILGLVQKNLLADNLGRWVDEGFLAKTSVANTTTDNWFLAIAFGLQVYFDFAAYSNMAIGAAKLIGVTLPENFRFPYLAKNPSDFWSRWHMTLSRWIRDYLFFPINSRFQGAPIPLYLSLLGVMGLVGMWHGIGWGFVVWGLMHGSYLVAYRIWENWKSPIGERFRQLRIFTLLWHVGTFIAVMLAWVPFRATSFAQIKQMLASMLLLHPNLRISYSINSYLVTLLCLAVALLEPQLARLIPKAEDLVGRDLKSSLASLYLARPLLYAFGLLLFLIFDEQNIQFIYFQF